MDQLRLDFWGNRACKCDTHKALDFPTFRFGTGGRWFKSTRPDQSSQAARRYSFPARGFHKGSNKRSDSSRLSHNSRRKQHRRRGRRRENRYPSSLPPKCGPVDPGPPLAAHGAIQARRTSSVPKPEIGSVFESTSLQSDVLFSLRKGALEHSAKTWRSGRMDLNH